MHGVIHLCARILVLSIFIPSLVTGCTKEQKSSATPTLSVSSDVVATSKVLFEIDDKEMSAAAVDGSRHGADTAGVTQNAQIVVDINKFGKGYAYIVKTGSKMRVVHNGKPGKLYDDLESNQLTLSPDGQRVGYAAKEGDSWFAVIDGLEKGASPEGGSVVFSADNRHVAYERKILDRWYFFVDDTKNSGADMYYDKAEFVSNSSKIMYIENTNQENAGIFRLVVSDLKFKEKSVRYITSPSYLTINNDKTVLAAVVKDKSKQRVVSFRFEEPDKVKSGAPFDEIISKIVVSNDGNSVTYLARNGDQSYLVLNDRAERLPQGEFPLPPALRPDGSGAGVVLVSNEKAYIHPVFYTANIQEKKYDAAMDLIYSADGSTSAYAAVKNKKFFIVVNGNEGPEFDRIVNPKFSPDGKYLVYSARKGDKRFVVVADSKNGSTLKQHAAFDRIFETVFTGDGKSVAYGAMSGRKVLWQVESL